MPGRRDDGGHDRMSAPSAGLAICTRGLRKTYLNRKGRHVAVQGLDLDVPVGGVHGFLGPNGSGKTTTIRMLLGLVRADAGTMQIFGTEVPRRPPAGRRPGRRDRRGAQVLPGVHRPPEPPAARGRDRRAPHAGRRGAGGDRPRGPRQGPLPAYSLGMKQRLAIAATLAEGPPTCSSSTSPPTASTRPASARSATTMRALGDQGKTVLVSSHILGEVEQVADTVSIIGHGRLLASGPVAQVIGQQAATSVRVGVADLEAAERVLHEGRPDGAAATRGLLLVEGVPDPAEVTRRLAHHEPLRQRARAGAGRPGVGLPAAHRPREPRGRPHGRRTEGAAMTRLGPRRAETPPAAPADALRRPRHPARGRAAGVPDRPAGPADVPQRARPGHRRLRAGAAGLRAERRAAAPGLPAGSRPTRARATPRPTSAATRRQPDARAMFLKPQLSFAGEVPGVLTGGAVLLALAALVLGAGFTASEFSTGSIGTWLTFEPRRLRVYGSKLLAAGAGVVPLAVLTLATMTAAVWVFASPLGQHDRPRRHLGPLAAVGGRAVLLVAAGRRWRVRRWASCCGTPPPSSAWRSGGPSPARASSAAPFRSAQPWLLNTNLTGWLQHGTTYLVERCTSSDGGYSCETIQRPLSFAHSATYLAVLAGGPGPGHRPGVPPPRRPLTRPGTAARGCGAVPARPAAAAGESGGACAAVGARGGVRSRAYSDPCPGDQTRASALCPAHGKGAFVTVAPEGRRMLRVEARNARDPDRAQAVVDPYHGEDGPGVHRSCSALVKSEGLHTVCQEAGCPNIFECWEDREATFLIGGEQCTRRCDFCQIDTGKPSRPRPRRAAPGRRVGAADGPALRDHHRRRPRRPRRRRRVALRRDDPPGARAQPGHRRRDPRPRLQRASPSWSARSSTPAPRCWRTTSRRCRASSSGSAPPSATSARSTSSPWAATPGW